MQSVRTLFFFAFFCVSLFFVLPAWSLSPEQALQWAHDENWAQDPLWVGLLHWDPKTKESYMDGPAYFVSKSGKFDLVAELDENLKRLLLDEATQPEPEQYQCRFPARTQFLRSKLAPHQLLPPAANCPRYVRWFETVRGKSISVIFSSYFINNPSSAFGHTFLRANKVTSDEKVDHYELLDYGFNFAANSSDDLALVYAIKGIFGGYPGTYTITPYYYKVREYSNAESRDLWDYELNLSPEAVDRLVQNVWELGPTYADYWYLSENCSFFILKVVEAAQPDLDLTSNLKKYITPKDTIVALTEQPNLVKTIRYRPSTRSLLQARMTFLSQNQQDLIYRQVLDLQWTQDLQALSEETQIQILDASIDLIDFQYPDQVQKKDSPAFQFKAKILKKRSQIAQISPNLSVDPPLVEQPHRGHGTRRAGIGFEIDPRHQNSMQGLLSYRFSFHDLDDAIEGYPPAASIRFFDFNFEFDRSDLRLQDFTLFEVRSLQAQSSISKTPSWGLRIASEKIIQNGCERCHGQVVEGHLGYTFEPQSGLSLTAALFSQIEHLQLKSIASDQDPRFLFRLGPEFSLRATMSNQWQGLFETRGLFDSTNSHSFTGSATLSAQVNLAQDRSLRISYRLEHNEETILCQYLLFH